MDTKCIITDLILISPDGDEWVPADLFVQDETLIVNANIHKQTGETDWRHLYKGDPLLPISKTLQLGTEFFEKRGVFVVSWDDCTLSHEAIAYVIRNEGIDLERGDS